MHKYVAEHLHFAFYYVPLLALLLASPARAHSHSCEDIFSPRLHHLILVAPENLPQETAIYLQAVATAQKSALRATSTNEALAYLAQKIEPYQSLLKDIVSSTRWDNELAELRDLLDEQTRIARNVNPTFFRRLTKRDGVHRLESRDVEHFFQSARDYRIKKYEVLDRIDLQERRFVELGEALAVLQTDLQVVSRLILESQIQDSMKPALVGYISRKMDLLNAQRATVKIKLPALEQERTLFTLQTTDLENFVSLHETTVLDAVASFAVKSENFLVISGYDADPSYGALAEYLRKDVDHRRLKMAYYLDPQKESSVTFNHVRELVGGHARLDNGLFFKPSDLFYPMNELVPKLDYTLGMQIYDREMKTLKVIEAMNYKGDVVIENIRKDPRESQILSAEEIRNAFYIKGWRKFSYSTARIYFIDGIGIFKVLAIRMNGDVIAEDGPTRKQITAEDMKRAQSVRD